MSPAAVASALLWAGAAFGQASLAVEVREEGPALGAQAALSEELPRSGWRAPTTSAPYHCALTGRLENSKAPKGVSSHYRVEVTSETGAALAQVDGEVKNASLHDARVQLVNAVRAALTAALTAHALPNALRVQGVDDDGQVRALRGALGAIPGVTQVDEGHFSNGEVRFQLSTRRTGFQLLDPLAEVAVGGRHLAVEYAGVDLVVTRLEPAPRL